MSSTPGAGHIGALLPTAVALRDAGADVRWAVAADGLARVAQHGFDGTVAGLDGPSRQQAIAADVPRVMAAPPEQRRGALFALIFARTAGPAMLPALAEVVDRERPDVIVRETAELAAVPVALARGIPLVTVAFSGVLPEWARPESVTALAPMWEVENVGAPVWEQLYGDLYVHPFPPSFGQMPEQANVRLVRPHTAPPAGEPPPWLASFASSRPGVYVTAGTEPPSATFPWTSMLAALEAMDVDAVVTTGPMVDPTALVAPPNVRLERFVPQAWLLPRVAAVVSHGGAGTLLGAAASGVPQVVVPLFADQWENGMAGVGAGCAVVLAPEQRTSDDCARALDTVLSSAAIAGAARHVAAEIEAMPTADRLVPSIEALGH